MEPIQRAQSDLNIPLEVSTIEEVKHQQLSAREQEIERAKGQFKSFKNLPEILGSAYFDAPCFFLKNPEHSLRHYVDTLCGKAGKLSIKDITSQTFEIIKEFHQKGYLHQKINEETFKVTGERVVFVDLGSTIRSMPNNLSDKMSEPQEQSTEPLNSLSKRDDLLSLAYMLMNLFQYNKLQWGSQTELDRQLCEDHVSVLEGANAIRLKPLLQFYKEVFLLRADQDPDYISLANLAEQNDLNYDPLRVGCNWQAMKKYAEEFCDRVINEITKNLAIEMSQQHAVLCLQCISKYNDMLVFHENELSELELKKNHFSMINEEIEKLREVCLRLNIEIVMAGQVLEEQRPLDVNAMILNQVKNENINHLSELNQMIREKETEHFNLQQSISSLQKEHGSLVGRFESKKAEYYKLNDRYQILVKKKLKMQDFNPTIAALQSQIKQLKSEKGNLSVDNQNLTNENEQLQKNIEENKMKLEVQSITLLKFEEESSQSSTLKYFGFIVMISVFFVCIITMIEFFRKDGNQAFSAQL
ncbi:hypothetical protein FGO68_gene14356 [Halteria grandinella]|uniref:Protein kinase domain-containing protein n=1 Tax=Halteria grandinella TaxID=5974 RepID=A0A8J8NRQ8_HALGN|nr:hypothetical protein FGO68_gene14356 [Halteria grandinella]